MKFILLLQDRESAPYSRAALEHALRTQSVSARSLGRAAQNRLWKPVEELLNPESAQGSDDSHSVRYYVIWLSRRESLPCSRAELEKAIQTNKVAVTTLAREAHSRDWKRAAELFPTLSSRSEPKVVEERSPTGAFLKGAWQRLQVKWYNFPNPVKPQAAVSRNLLHSRGALERTTAEKTPQPLQSISTELRSFAQMHKAGILSDEEFKQAKAKLLQ